MVIWAVDGLGLGRGDAGGGFFGRAAADSLLVDAGGLHGETKPQAAQERLAPGRGRGQDDAFSSGHGAPFRQMLAARL